MSSILQWFTNLFTGLNLGSVTSNVVTLGLTLFALILGGFSLNYLNKRRQSIQTQQTAALIKGLHYAGVAQDVLNTARTNPRDHLLSGLRWLFAAAALSGVLYGSAKLQPSPDTKEAIRGALVGIIPGAIGLAHLLFSWVCRAKSAITGSSMTYRTAAGRRS